MRSAAGAGGRGASAGAGCCRQIKPAGALSAGGGSLAAFLRSRTGRQRLGTGLRRGGDAAGHRAGSLGGVPGSRAATRVLPSERSASAGGFFGSPPRDGAAAFCLVWFCRPHVLARSGPKGRQRTGTLVQPQGQPSDAGAGRGHSRGGPRRSAPPHRQCCAPQRPRGPHGAGGDTATCACPVPPGPAWAGARLTAVHGHCNAARGTQVMRGHCTGIARCTDPCTDPCVLHRPLHKPLHVAQTLARCTNSCINHWTLHKPLPKALRIAKTLA